MIKIFGAKLNGTAIRLVTLFNAVEIVIMVGWLQLVLTKHPVAGFVVLAVGLTVEHFISAATGVHVEKE